MKNYSEKFAYIFKKQSGCCAIAKSKGKIAQMTELHHAGVNNSKVNRRLYPLFIDSVWNLIGVNHDYHLQSGSFGRISFLEAEKRERFLERHPVIAKKINMEDKE